MAYTGEVGFAQLIKYGEVTCGDAVEVIRNEDNVVIVLSDGLGSGVKANILSNLTAKIASKMISSNISIEDVVETLVQTLPTCSVRGLAYSTFSILRIYDDGIVHLMDFDGIKVLRIYKNVVKVVKTASFEIAGRKINEAFFRMREGELLLVVSDGVVEAGLGLTLPMGLGVNGLIKALEKDIRQIKNAQDLANQVIEICQTYYLQEPGDDTTAVAVRLKKAKHTTIMTGPAKNKQDDSIMIEQFLAQEGAKIICGGTTAQIFARETNRTICKDFEPINDKIPPISAIEGVDLVTEGIITLTEALNYFDQMPQRQKGDDGANLLLDQLLESDTVTFILGLGENLAYKEMQMSIMLNLREVVINRWQKRLTALGKTVRIITY